MSLGQKLACREPPRCKHCYLQGLCDALDGVLEARSALQVDVLRYAGEPPFGELPRADVARIVATNIEEARRIAGLVSPPRVELELSRYAGLADVLGDGGTFAGKSLAACYTARPADVADLLAIQADFEVRVFLTKATAEALRAL